MDYRYLLFAGDHYYPAGGVHDLVGSYESLDEAINITKEYNYDWAHVWDQTNSCKVWDKWEG